MKFRTEIQLPAFPFKIGYDDSILFIGSCFADNIGSFFEKNGFNVMVNPFGTLFNPISISSALKIALNPSLFDEKYLINHNGLWHSFAHHGKFSKSDRETLISEIATQLDLTRNFLLTSNFLFITFGTSYVYRYKKENFIVANCHKIPGTEFVKELLTASSIVEEYEKLLTDIKKVNPDMKIIFTISPVRHLGDGFRENNLSKGTLHLAVNELLKNGCYYFPSYEIFQDDLRDYRYYGQDLCHPSEFGVRYLEEKIAEALFTAETEARRKEIEKENKAAAHRPNVSL